MPDASVDVGTVRQRFNFDWAMSEPVDGLDTYWWWARSIRIDPNEVIADDDEGNLWSVPFTTDGADTVTFDTPVRVRETFVPVTAGEGATATAVVQRRRQHAAEGASALQRPSKPTSASHPSHPAATERHDHEEDQAMPIDLDALRTRLGLPEDAGEEQINEALATEPEATISEEQVTERVETAVAAAREEERQRASAASQDGRTVTLDREQWEATQADAQAGRTAREEQISASRDQLVAAAVEDGRIGPASRQAWREALDARPEAEAAALAGLEKGRIPVTERGVASTGPDSENDLGDTATTGWFPQLQEA